MEQLFFMFFFYDISISAEEGITVGKFYATFLIQEYFRRFKKKRQDERRRRNADSTVSLKVCLNTIVLKNRKWK